jgi:hypothetical protein
MYMYSLQIKWDSKKKKKKTPTEGGRDDVILSLIMDTIFLSSAVK